MTTIQQLRFSLLTHPNRRNKTHIFDSQIFVSHVTFRLEVMKLLASHTHSRTNLERLIDWWPVECVPFEIRAHYSNGMSYFYDFKFRRNQFWKFILRAVPKCVDHKIGRMGRPIFLLCSARLHIQFSVTLSLPLPRCLVCWCCNGIWLTGLTRWKIDKQWRRRKNWRKANKCCSKWFILFTSCAIRSASTVILGP